MVRLVFRPYTQLRRSICTSESLRSSIRVSPDFNLARHSSRIFRVPTCMLLLFCVNEVTTKRQGCASTQWMYDHPSSTETVLFAFTSPRSLENPATCTHVRLLGPCFKTGQRRQQSTHNVSTLADKVKLVADQTSYAKLAPTVRDGDQRLLRLTD